MSTQLARMKGTAGDGLSVMRFCGPADEGSDRIRVSLFIYDEDNGMAYTLTREQWAELRYVIDRGFEEYPAQ